MSTKAGQNEHKIGYSALISYLTGLWKSLSNSMYPINDPLILCSPLPTTDVQFIRCKHLCYFNLFPAWEDAINEPHQFDIAMNSTSPPFFLYTYVKIPIFSGREKVKGGVTLIFNLSTELWISAWGGLTWWTYNFPSSHLGMLLSCQSLCTIPKWSRIGHISSTTDTAELYDLVM